MRKKKLRQQRPEAFWGALIGAGASILGSVIGGKSQADSARAQADAILQASRENAKALEEQNKNNNLLQEQSMKFIADQNAEARQFQRDLQTSMQMQAGQLSTDERRTANRIQVKKGGKVRRSNKGLRDASFPLRAGNLPFRVTDGGGVIPIGTTPEGYDLYEIIGNDHDHYHKTRNGKRKAGVGIKFDNGQVVEGEGNQNSTQGEYLLTTPNAGLFISKHSVNGFNPVQAINSGMHPIDAYQIQEANKDHNSSPVKGRYAAHGGFCVAPVLAAGYSPDIMRKRLKRGGRVKAATGFQIGHLSPTTLGANWLWKQNGYFPGTDYNLGTNYNLSNPSTTSDQSVTVPASTYNGAASRWGSGLSGNIIGAGITGLGNLLGAGLSNIFINRGARIGANAALEAGRIQANALRNLQTVDMSMLDGENGRLMFSRGHYMPVTESTRVYDNAQREDIRRLSRRALGAANTGSASSAARLSRMSGINATSQEMLSKVNDTTLNQEAENRRANMAAINEAGRSNIQLDIESLRDRTAARLDLLKYNNDIVNRRIAEPAQVEAEALANAAGIRSNAKNAIGQGWASAVAGTGQALGNAFATDAAQNANIRMALAGASSTGQYNYYMSGDTYDRSGAYGVYSDYVAMSKSAKDSRDKDEWLYRANQLANKYNFPTV